MTHPWLRRIAFVLIFALTSGVAYAQISADEKQELEMAENAIITRLVLLSASPYICTEQPTQCISADGIELGTALVAARDTPQSLRALVRLRRFGFDASYGETYDEYLCKKGTKIEKYLARLDPQELRNRCVTEFDTLIKTNPELKSAKVDTVCTSVDRIRRDVRETLEMIRRPAKSCEP